MMVLGHELLHRLAKDRPTIYRELVARLMKQVQNGNDYFEQLSARYEAGGMSTKQVRFGEELIADIVGDFFGDPQFWRDMKAEQPTLFVRLVDWVLRFLDGVIARMRGIKTENIDAYVKDVEQARAAVVSAMRAYSREMTAQEPAAAVDGVLMGRQLGGSGVDLAKAWHGTPHRGIQKFSTDKIGTGEGAQAFGWGLYFSSRREIADWYRRNLTRAPDSIALDGQVFPSLWAGVQAGAFTDDERRLMDDYELADAIASLNFSEAIEAFRAAPYDAEDRRAVKALADRLSKPTPDQLSVGQLYEVDMPEDGELLLWDKPLGEQPAKVRESVRRMLGDVPRDWLDDALERLNADEIELTGQDIYHLMQRAVRDDALVPNTGTAAEQAVIDGADDKAASLLLAEDGIKGIKYLDGTSRGAGGGAHNYVIFSGDDVTIEGTHFSVGGDIALSVGQPGQFELRKFGAAAKTIEAIQDRYNRWKQAIADVRKQGGKITEENDFYRTEERYWGVVGSQLEDFRANELLPLVKAVAADGLTLDQVAEYAYAEHAPYRNKWIADKRPDMPDGGSGMTDADAAAIISAAAANGTEQALQRHAQALRDMAAGTRDTLRDNGLISDDEHAAWSALPYYVPLRGIDGDTGAHAAAGTARGFNIRGKEAKEARGRKSRAKDILENIANDRARALVRAGKNEVLRSFLAFVMDNPSPNLWEVNAVQRKPLWTTDDQGNRVLVPEKSLITDQSTVAVKDGGRIIYIRIKDQRLLEQLQGLNNEQVTLGIGALLWANRQLSRLYTSLSPVFVVMNAIRDLWGASVGMIDEVGFMGAARLWSSLPGAAVHAWNAEVRGKNSPAYDEFRHSGGKTGFMDLKSIDDQAAELGRLMRRASRSAWNPMGWLPALMTLIENINAFVENTTRFAAFRAARASGLTLARSANISKNITVNFNRRGTMTPFLGAFSLFFNPAVQGSMRVAQALSNPKTLATLSTGAVGIFMLALQNASMGEDDDGVAWWDKIPADVKERNLVIVLPAGAAEGEPVKGSKVGRYIKIPMPYGYNFFAVAANELADVMRHQQDPRRGRDMAGAGLRLMKAFTGSWVPMREVGDGLGGEPESFLQAAVPDALGPFGQIWANRSAFGRTLRPEDRHNANMPDSTKAFPGQVGTIWHQSAEWLNAHTGGSQFREGLIDVAPSTIETLVRGYGGGLVSVPLDIMNAMYVRQSISREAVRADALPLRKQLLGVIDAETDRSLGYERLEKAEEGVEKISAARKAGNREEVKRLREDFAEVERLGGQVQMTRDRLAYLRKRELAIISSDKPDAEKFARLQVLAVDHRVALQRFNAAFDKARADARASAQKPAEATE
jgi:hypothetical protein